MPTNKDQITVYLEPEIKAKLQQWAEEERRSMAFIAAQVIEDAIAAREKKQRKS